MNDPLDNENNSSRIPEVGVVDFLRSHPDFFTEHTDLLNRLSVPHQAGTGIVSLIEKQVQIMRRRIEDLEQKLEQTEHEESFNIHLVENVRRLAFDLLNTENPEEFHRKLVDGLSAHYKADQFRLYVFTRLPTPNDCGGIRFRTANAGIKCLFTGVFNHHRPLCGSLQDEHIKAVFGNDAEFIRSTVLIPLKLERWEGLLALGSRQWNYYHHGLSLELLVMVSDIASKVIDGWLASTSHLK